MDMSNKTPLLVFLVIYINCVSVARLDMPQLNKLTVNILDGEVIVLWNHPVDAPPNSKYNVQMAKYFDEWAMVASCTGITNTYCDLSSHIHDYDAGYKVRVKLVAGDDESEWSAKKFLPNTSELQPPSFTLRATSSTLTVYVHEKPILKKLFHFGVIYTIYLEERGEYTKNTTAYLKDDVGEDQRTKTFSSLHWGREYCVSLKVEGNGALAKSSVSHKECLLLPEQEWFITAVSCLSILGVLAFIGIMATAFQCYLKRPEKTPAALKSPVSGWLPLSVREGTMEVVHGGKGWFLSSYRREVKDPVTHVTVIEDSEEEDRRSSMDSGVSMESNSAANSRGSPPTRQEDSGCGSLGGPESSTSSQTDYPMQEGRSDTDIARKREDSGVGLGCQLGSLSMKLDEQDSGSLKEAVAGGNYRSQSHSVVQINGSDDEEMFKQMLPGSILAEVVTGYRAGPQSCICSGAGQCSWCHKQGHYGTEVIKQYKTMCIDNGILSGKCDFVDSYKGALTFSSYSEQMQMDTVTMDDLETTFIQLGETFPLLTALSPLPIVEGGHDFNMNNVALSLCDVQLKTD
ncbi:interleukin-10 receptor subunit alpha [Micropterus salmoides]|uniref:interleukin-10 receptor subunit alpha n=1 Tax=Micropterus salmoides TaxID=27706 RepID=UPI0018EDE10E|nr:interleukin-10 receptor subunit alpha [Micropterus salmoides]